MGDGAAAAPWQKEDDGYDAQRWGSRIIRNLQPRFLAVDGVESSDLAAVHLTFVWAANTNVVPSAFWLALDVFRNPKLLSQVRARLPRIKSAKDFIQSFSQAKVRDGLCEDALLQSIYAETLRYRIHAYAFRQFSHDVVDLDGWIIPKDRLYIVSTHPAHFHGEEWNTDGGRHALTEFWPYRFLVPPQDGIQDAEIAQHDQGHDDDRFDDPGSWAFSMRGLNGSWIPFGGGPRACPGRHLSKHHMIVTMAAMVSLFDVEIGAEKDALVMDERNYGLGCLHPVGKVPYKIRRRFLS